MQNNPLSIYLSKTHFSEFERRKKYLISSFLEDQVKITVLIEQAHNNKINSGNKYVFGEIIGSDMYWYNQGNPIAFSREEMRNVFSTLNDLKKDKNTIIFTYKIKR